MATTHNDVRLRLSLTWIFVMLNMLYADIFSFMSPGTLKMFMEGRAEDIVLTPMLILVFAIVTEIPLAMALLSYVLPERLARWANIVVAPLTVVYIWGGASALPHYYFIAAIETLGLALIAWTAWNWRVAEAHAPARRLVAE